MAYSFTFTTSGSQATITGPANFQTEIIIPQYVYENSVEYTVTSIAYNAFNGSSITSIVIPDSVTDMGEHAFLGSSIRSITIPNRVESIRVNAFHSCGQLTSIVIGSSVTRIELQAFLGCSSLTSIVIPPSVTQFGGHPAAPTSGGIVFSECTNLTSVFFAGTVIPATLTVDTFDTAKVMCYYLDSATGSFPAGFRTSALPVANMYSQMQGLGYTEQYLNSVLPVNEITVPSVAVNFVRMLGISVQTNTNNGELRGKSAMPQKSSTASNENQFSMNRLLFSKTIRTFTTETVDIQKEKKFYGGSNRDASSVMQRRKVFNVGVKNHSGGIMSFQGTSAVNNVKQAQQRVRNRG